jgi:transcription-repair coupling factor (superfamily II helicase)
LALHGLLPLLIARPEFKRLRDLIDSGAETPLISGVAEVARPYLVAALAQDLRRPILYVVRDDEQVERVADALATLLGKDTPVLPYMEGDALPYERLMPDMQGVKTRINALAALQRAQGGLVVVCSARALTQPVMPPETFAAAVREIRPGQRMEPRDLLAYLMSLGYEPEVEVEDVGQVTHRGGIVDFFPPALERPARVEFFGDEIESLRTFDPVTQRSLNPQDAVRVTPARDALATNGPQAVEQLAKLSLIGLNPDARARWQNDLEALRGAQSFADIAFYMPYLHEQEPLLAYLPGDGLLILHDDASVRQTAEQLAEQGEEVRERLEREGETPPGLRPAFIPWAALEHDLARQHQLRWAALR